MFGYMKQLPDCFCGSGFCSSSQIYLAKYNNSPPIARRMYISLVKRHGDSLNKRFRCTTPDLLLFLIFLFGVIFYYPPLPTIAWKYKWLDASKYYFWIFETAS